MAETHGLSGDTPVEELLAGIKPEFWDEPGIKCDECDDTGYVLTLRPVHNALILYSKPCLCETGRQIVLTPKSRWAADLPAKDRTAWKRLGTFK